LILSATSKKCCRIQHGSVALVLAAANRADRVSSIIAGGVVVHFANQVAIITGASSGIGWELARTLAAQQCAVGLVARRKDRLDALVQEIQSAGGKAACAAADVADRSATLAAIHSLRDQLGPVDLLIANSGVGV